jgi:hypothetical protein
MKVGELISLTFEQVLSGDALPRLSEPTFRHAVHFVVPITCHYVGGWYSHDQDELSLWDYIHRLLIRSWWSLFWNQRCPTIFLCLVR